MSQTLNRSQNFKGGLGWTKRTWEQPQVKKLKFSEWDLFHRQRMFYFATRTAGACLIPITSFLLVHFFLPTSISTKVRARSALMDNVYAGERVQAIKKRYHVDSNVTPLSEASALMDRYGPGESKRERLENWIRVQAAWLLGEKTRDVEKEVYDKAAADKS